MQDSARHCHTEKPLSPNPDINIEDIRPASALWSGRRRCRFFFHLIICSSVLYNRFHPYFRLLRLNKMFPGDYRFKLLFMMCQKNCHQAFRQKADIPPLIHVLPVPYTPFALRQYGKQPFTILIENFPSGNQHIIPIIKIPRFRQPHHRLIAERKSSPIMA